MLRVRYRQYNIMFAMVLYRIVILLLYSFRHQLLLRIIILTHYRQRDVTLTADLIEYNVHNHTCMYICVYIMLYYYDEKELVGRFIIIMIIIVVVVIIVATYNIFFTSIYTRLDFDFIGP